MSQNNETRVSKSATFEEWRQSSNSVAFELGPIGSNINKTSDSLDLEGRLTDQLKTVVQGSSITTGDEFIQDQSTGSIASGMRIELAPDKKIDMTAGYIIFTGAPTVTGFAVDALIQQKDVSGTITFSAKIVSITQTRVLITEASGAFDAAKAILLTSNNAITIAANKVVRQEVGTLDDGYVRVYKTNSGTTTQLAQDTISATGFHIPKATHSITFDSSATVPATFLEAETIFQGSNFASASFTAKILFITTAKVVLYDVNGTFSTSLALKSKTTESNTIAASFFNDGAAGDGLVIIPQTFTSIIRLNTPCASGDTYTIHYGSAVDAILELQDDIGTVESLSSAAGFGMTGNRNTMSGSTDLQIAINNLHDIIGTDTLPSHTTSFTAAGNNSTVSGAVKQVMTFIGNDALSQADLGDNDDTPSTLTASINAIKGFIGITGIATIGSADTITKAISQLHTELGDVSALDDADSGGRFNSAEVVASLVELRNAIVGDNDLTDTVDTLDANAGTAGGYQADDVVAAIVEIQKIIGDRTALDQNTLGDVADTPNNIVTAIDNIKAYIGTTVGIAGVISANTNDDTLTGAINQLHTEIGEQALSNGSNYNTAAETSLSHAIHGIQAMLGDNNINNIGSENNLSSAVNKLHTELGNADSLNNTPTAFVNNSTDGTGGFRNTAGGSGSLATVVSALTELRQALVGSTIHLAAVTNARADTDTDSTIVNALPDLANLTGYSKTNVIDAILEVQALIGDVTSLDDADNLGRFETANIVASLVELRNAIVGDNDLTDTVATLDTDGGGTDFTSTNLVAAITEIQGDLGQQSLLTASPFHADLHGSYANTDFQIAINAISAAIGDEDIGAAINSGDETLTNAIKQLRIDIGDAGSSGAALNTATKNVVGAINELNTELGDVADINNATGYAATTAVTGLTEIQGLIGEVTANNLGTTASTLVTAIRETTNELGAVSAANMGTTASTVVTAINELATTKLAIGANSNAMKTAMGTNSDTVTAAIKELVDGTGAASVTVKSQTPISSGLGKLDKVSASTQTLVGDIDFNAPHASNAAAETTLKFGANTVLDVSAGTLKLSSASAPFNIQSTFLNLQGTAANGQGLQIDRSNITGVTIAASTDAFLQWREASISINNPASAHNLNDIAWEVKGLTSVENPQSYTAPNVDFQNAYRLFGIGTTNVANTENGVNFTWDDTNKHFDVALSSGVITTGAQAYGTASLVPVITVDTHGRVTSITTTNVSNSLGEYTLQATSGTQQLVGVNDSVKIAGTNNEITTAISTSNSVHTVTIGLPDNVTIGNDLTVADKITVNGTAGVAADLSVFTGDVNIGGALAVTGAITQSGGASFGFSTTSATVSSKAIILNALTTNATNDIAATTGQAYIPAASFVAHRGFQSTQLDGAVNTLSKGKRYRIVHVNTGTAISANEQAGLQAIGGVSDTLANNDIITAAIRGDLRVGDSSNIKLLEQESEAKIAWNETNDQFVLYRGSETAAVSTDTTTGAIIAQGDTIGAAQIYTSTETDDSPSGGPWRMLFSGTEADKTDILRSDNAIQYNSSTNQLTIGSGKILVGDGINASNTITGGAQIEIVNANPKLIIRDTSTDVAQVDARLRLAESNSANGNINNYWDVGFIADSFQINDMTDVRLHITNAGNVGIGNTAAASKLDVTGTVTSTGLDVNGNATVDGTLTHNGLFTQALANPAVQANKLGRTATNTNVGAIFNGRVGHTSAQSKIQIEDVRMTTQASGSETASTAAKRIQHVIDTSDFSFIDFQGSSSNIHEVRLGGEAYSVTKTYLKGQSNGATELYHNVASGTASAKKLETTDTGIAITGGLTTDYLDLTGGETTTTTGYIAAKKIVLNDPTGDGADGSDACTIYTEEGANNQSKLVIHCADDGNDQIVLRTDNDVDTLTVDSNGVYLPDGKKLGFGAAIGSPDLEIFHDGTNSYVQDAGTGQLILNTTNGGGVYIQSAGETAAQFISNGAVNLYHDNAHKFATTSTGIDVTGTVTQDGLIFSGQNDTINVTHNAIRLTTENSMHFDSYNDFVFNMDTNTNGTTSDFVINKNANASQHLFKVAENGDVKFYGYSDDVDTTPASTFNWDSSIGSLGLGVDPTVRLEVNGTTKTKNFLLSNDDASNAVVQAASGNVLQKNRIVLSNSTNTDRVGILNVQSAQVGGTDGNASVQAVFSSANANKSYLQILDERDSNGTTWNQAHKRIEFGIDVTRMGYIAQNLNEDYGLEIGTSGAGGADAAFASQPWISMRKAATGNGAGAVELYHGNSGTSTKKLETTAEGVIVSGIAQADVFRNPASNTTYNLLTRNANGLNTLFVQNAHVNGHLASFRKGSATANAGTEVFGIQDDLINVAVNMQTSGMLTFTCPNEADGTESTDRFEINTRVFGGNLADSSLDFTVYDNPVDRFTFRGTYYNAAPVGNVTADLLTIYKNSSSLTNDARVDVNGRLETLELKLTASSQVVTSIDTDISATSASHDTLTTALAAKTYTDSASAAAVLAATGSTNGRLLIGGTSGPLSATLTAGEGIDITNGDRSITITAETATSSNLGIAKFSTNDFSVTSGNVTIKADAITTDQIAGDAVTFGRMQNIATNTIMGRSAAGTSDPQALTAAQARGVLNVADNADYYNAWKLRANTSSTTDIGAGETVSFTGSNATSVTRNGNTITISSTDNNTTYSAHGGISSTDSKGIYLDTSNNQFKLTNSHRNHSQQDIGNNSGTLTRYHTSDYISWYTRDPVDNGSSRESMRLDKSPSSPGANVGLEVNGDITAFSNAITSDRKLKENIVTVDNALDKVSQLNGVEFDWKDGRGKSAGVIAQDVEKVLPQLVSQAKGFSEVIDETYKVVDYNGLSSLFIEAIKELKEQNELMKAEIEELKANK